MTTLVVELPTEIDAEEARLLLAIKLYEMGRLSLGQAAQLAGYSKPAFMELLGKYGAPVFATHLKSYAQRLNGEAAECL
jgi:predicted HTH domain antitoxin